TPAAAQGATRSETAYDKEFGVKYSILYEEEDWANVGFLVEGGAKVCAFGTWNCSVVGELAFNRLGGGDGFDGVTYTTYQGGLRFGKVLNGKTRPFVQLQIGGQSCCDENAFLFTPGGGFNFPNNERFDVQVQADFPFASYSGDWYNQFRLSFGVGVPLGQ